ncbi:MAG: ubiquinone anaerobic biosynthesis accessory factor UbiT [Burkholderiaceae bacterium]
MNQNRNVVPKPIGKLLSLLPLYPGSLLFVTGLNLALRDRLPGDVQQSLIEKKLRIQVTDAQLVFDFQWTQRGFIACHDMVEADLTIGASAYDFLLLARRQEDPDTLFFSRRLSMEGDTELGLLIKNTLDAMEFRLFETVRKALPHVPT